MQDDVYLIAIPLEDGGGWRAETYRVIEKDKKGKEKDKGWTCDLIPKSLIVARYFAKERASTDRLAAELEGATARLAELAEEHGGEDGVFAELDKVNKANVAARLKELQAELRAESRPAQFPITVGSVAMVAEAPAPYGDEDTSEADILLMWLNLSEQEADLKKRLKDAETALDVQAYARYPKLTEAEIKTLVVDDKWLATLDAAIHGEMDRVSQRLTQRVKELAECYETPLPQMVSRVEELEANVNCHLKRMGFSWK